MEQYNKMQKQLSLLQDNIRTLESLLDMKDYISIDVVVENLQEICGFEWTKEQLTETSSQPNSILVFRIEDNQDSRKRVVEKREFLCPHLSKGGYYAGGRGGLYFHMTLRGALLPSPDIIFVCAVDRPTKTITLDQERWVHDIINEDTRVVGVSANREQDEYVKTVGNLDGEVTYKPKQMWILRRKQG